MKNIQLTTNGIMKNLRKIKPYRAVCEYIWNGFDANATIVNIDLVFNQLGGIETMIISDNGDGINYENLREKFLTFNQSSKDRINDDNHSIPHGKLGIGRLTFFSFAASAKWETVYSKGNSKYKYFLEINTKKLHICNDNNGEKPKETNEMIGTRVILSDIFGISDDELKENIKKEFFWFLELNKYRNYSININGEKLLFDDLYESSLILNLDKYNLSEKYEVRIVQWKIKLGNEYSKYYYINSNDEEKYKEATSLNNKSDNFNHSIFIKSSYFDEFDFTENKSIENQISIFNNKSDDEFKRMKKAISEELLEYRKTYLKKSSEKYINELKAKDIYPKFSDSGFDIIKKEELDKLIATLYIAEPKIFTGLSNDNKKITIHLLNLIMENSNKPELFEVLKQIIDLSEEELIELHEVLKYTSLNNITKTIKLLQDRLKVINELKKLVFDSKMYNTKEVPHLQTIVENHYWIFGEQYNLVVAEDSNFDKALRGLILRTTGIEENVKIDHEDKNKQMDIYMIRQNRTGKVLENVVVELKRPSVSLGESELSQVKRYMRLIAKDDRFNASKTKWSFYLVGNKFSKDEYIEMELGNNKDKGEEHLVFKNGNQKLFVLKWSDIFDEFNIKHNYLMDKLKVEEELWLKEHNNADEIVDDIKENSATMPSAIIPNKKDLALVK